MYEWSLFAHQFQTLLAFFPNLWGIISSSPITINTPINLMFHNFLSTLERAKYFSLSLDIRFIITPCGFLTPALADGLPPGSEWQQIFSSLLLSPGLFSVML